MIGVVAEASNLEVISEFFELFKTPWEPYKSARDYEVLLCSDGLECETSGAKLVLRYCSRKLAFDRDRDTIVHHEGHGGLLSRGQDTLPVYGQFCSFGVVAGTADLTDQSSNRPVTLRSLSGNQQVVRVGYDLFDEVRHLLSAGQPAHYARIPTLELHIDLLRRLIVSAGIELIEIPPAPPGYEFITCLTHDVDHPSLRRHGWDHTSFGFLYRAIIGSLREYLSGTIPFCDLGANWAAAFRSPFVFIGLARDFWSDFPERYQQIEKNVPSTWFVVPFSGYAGRAGRDAAPPYRATRYGAADIAGRIRDLMAYDCEVGLHGLDAWLDELSGRRELEEIRRITGTLEIGTRMHWLFFDRNSPAVLERAGASYDSTVGYRETVGFRAGTTQAYRPLGAETLLELPMHVMDTALFYPAYLELSQERAVDLLKQLMAQMEQFGGCLTINWHDRSLAPERQWSMSYRALLDDLKARKTWFATASEVVAWFRKRRAFKFEAVEDKTRQFRRATECHDGLPGLQMQTYNCTPIETAEKLAPVC